MREEDTQVTTVLRTPERSSPVFSQSCRNDTRHEVSHHGKWARTSDVHLRAGMKLTLETSRRHGHQVYREWVDLTSDLVDQGISAAVIRDDARGHRLAWNLCAGFAGAVNAVGVLAEDVESDASEELGGGCRCSRVSASGGGER